MAKTIRIAKNLSRRTLSVVLACAVFAVMMLTVLAGAVLISKAINPSALEALNHEVPVQEINMMPTKTGDAKYVNPVTGAGYISTSSRTTFAGDSATYLDVAENNDGSVKMSVKKTKANTVSTDTTYALTYTQINQKINLLENPYLSIAFKSSGARLNGWVYFTITRGGTTYGINTSTDKIFTVTNPSNLTPSNTQLANSGFDFYRIFNYRNDDYTVDYINEEKGQIDYEYNQNSGNGHKDFWVSSKHENTVDFYGYLYGYFQENGWISTYWPDWGVDGNYLTVTYVSHVIVSGGGDDDRGVGQPLKQGSYGLWTKCYLGRNVFNQQGTLLPSVDEAVAPYNTDTERRALLDDGRLVFRNHSTSAKTFQWDIMRYVNIAALDGLVFDAQYSGSTTMPTISIALLGKNNTRCVDAQGAPKYDDKGNPVCEDHYTAEDVWLSVDTIISNYSNNKGVSDATKYQNATINFKAALDAQVGATFYPSDSLVCIREVKVTLPAGAKLTINKFSPSIRNDYVASTTDNTVYPWSTELNVDTLPPEGTPATTANLDSASGANSAMYNWAANTIPTVEHKVDLLAMTDQHINYYPSNDSSKPGQFKDYDTTQATGYWRTTDGKSHFTSNTSNIVYREFHRRDKSVTSYVSTDGGNNFYMEIPVGTTPYLYYSYTLSSTNATTNKAVGLYFYFANSINDVSGLHNNYYYLGQSGLSLLPCDNLINDNEDASVSNAYRALCSTAEKRTGIIDLRSIGFKDSDIALIEDMRFYLTGLNTTATFDYLFFGSETLADSAKTTIAKNSGDAFPWAITHDQFKAATIGTGADFTFANRIDVISDMIDRKKWMMNDASKRVTTAEAVATYGSAMTYNDDGSITLTASTSQRFVQVGHGKGYDHFFTFKINKNDLASLRYLNYSVSADPGMRWSIMLKSQNAGASGQVGAAICTWADAYMSGDFLKNNKTSKETVGKSYFREMNFATIEKYWYNGNHWTTSAARDNAWAMFTIPGSQTGCFDLSQIQQTVDWTSINEVLFIAYKDPSLKNAAGTSNVSGSVTFNYLYLTSEPLLGSSFGAASTKAGVSYSWPYVNSGHGVSFTGTTYGFHTGVEQSTWGKDFYRSDKSKLSFTSDHKSNYTLYYGFNFTDRATGKVAYPNIHISFWENSWGTYRFRQRTGRLWEGSEATGYINFGEPTLTGDTGSDDMGSVAHGVYRMQIPETGAIALNKTGLNGLTFVRVYFDNSKYQCNVDYLIIAKDTPTQSNAPAKLASKKADFSTKKYVIDMGRTDIIAAGTTLTATKTYKQSVTGWGSAATKTVDLYKTPYLFYSIDFPKNADGTSKQTGTFEFLTDATAGGSKYFYRDGNDSAQGSLNLLVAGQCNATGKYIKQSETGCIDVLKWYQSKEAVPSTGKLTISQVRMLIQGSGTTKIKYMYFGAKADKTIDLIPNEANGKLSSGVDTHSWTDGDGGSGELSPNTSSTTSDKYISGKLASLTESKYPIKVKYTGDANGDNYNNLNMSTKTWGHHAVCYGEVMSKADGDYTYVSTGNNQMSGLTINLKETPYLHFSFSQPETSLTTFVLQANNCTNEEMVRNELPDKVKPWLSAYNPQSPAGQMVQIVSHTENITHYKDTVFPDEQVFLSNPQNRAVYSRGDFSGVIDLRTWYTVSNGFGDIVNLDRVRFYATTFDGSATEVTVNHFYLSSSSGSSYSVTFEKNDGTGTKSVVQVLKNANKQYVSDITPQAQGLKSRSNYTFVGWYTDPNWENYYDIKKEPIVGDLTLYAGWIKYSDVSTTEVNMLANAGDSTKVTKLGEGEGKWESEDDALHIENTGDIPYTMQLEVKKAYSIYDFHSFYAGFDTSKTCEGASIVVDLKSLGSHEYDLLADPFSSHFLTDEGLLTAAPYNRELPIYATLASRNILPVKENTEGYVYIDTVTFSVPAGVSMHVRYLSAAKSMEVVEAASYAPEIASSSSALDLLDCTDDNVEQARNVEYELENDATPIYGNSSRKFGKVTVKGPAFGYLTIGSLYQLGDPLGEFPISSSDKRYLYFDVTQSEESKTTFNMWCTVYYKPAGSSTEKTAYPSKWSTFYNGATKGLGSQADMDNGNIPANAYFSGSRSGCIDLYEWYSTALASSQPGATVTKIGITGLRIYSTNGGTDATFNYIAIGKAASQSTVKAQVVYKNASGGTSTVNFSDEKPGQNVNIALDDLTDCPAASDPTQTFKGWSFSSATGTPVYWNPAPKNGDQYNASTNPNGAWSTSAVSGFVQQRADVTYLLSSTTQKIYPVFQTTAPQTLQVKFSGSGTVKVTRGDTGATASITAATSYTDIPYGTRVVLSTDAESFAGWTDASGRLVSAANECVVDMYETTAITATFGTAKTLSPDTWGSGKSIVWLQSSDLTAGTDFKLQPVKNGSITKVEEVKSNINDVSGTKEIICYWALDEGQMVQAVTKSGYHWEQLLKDGTTMRVSEGNTYTFITSPTIKLVSVKDGSTTFNGAVVYNEYAVSFDRDPADKTAIINTQIVPKAGEEIATCGIVIADRPSGVKAPSYRSAESVKVTASAWNSTTGQFTVDCPFTVGKAYYIRSYAVMKNTTTGEYTLRYGNVTAITF